MRTLAFLLFISISLHLRSQSVDAASLRLEVNGPYELFGTIPIGEKGVIFYNKKPGGPLHLEKYNTDLIKQCDSDIIIPKGYYFADFTQSLRFLHFIFTNKKGEFIYYKIVLWDFKYQSIENTFSKKTIIKDILATDKFVYILTELKSTRTINQISLNTFSLLPVKLDSKEIKNSAVVKGEVIPSNNHVIFYGTSGGISNNTPTAFEFNEFGELAHTIVFAPGEHTRLENIKATSLGKGVMIFTGTYSCSEFPQGIFICKTAGGKTEFYKQYPFQTFNCFADLNKYLILNGSGKCKKEDLQYDIQIITYPVVKTSANFLFETDIQSPYIISFSQDGNIAWNLKIDTEEDMHAFQNTSLLNVKEIGNSIHILSCGNQNATLSELNKEGEIISGMKDAISDNCRTATTEFAGYWFKKSFLFTGYSDTSVEGKLFYLISKLSL